MNSSEFKTSLFKSAVAKVKQACADMSEEACNALIEEAIEWARTGAMPAKPQAEKSPETQ